MILPHRCARMCGTANLDIRYVPRRLTAITKSKTSIGTSSMSWRSRPCGAPAPFTRMSSLPRQAAAVSTIRLASSATEMSPSCASAVPPAAVISSTRDSTPPQDSSVAPTTSWRRLSTPVACLSVTTTATPDAARFRAMARPMPSRLPQPVMSATRVVNALP